MCQILIILSQIQICLTNDLNRIKNISSILCPHPYALCKPNYAPWERSRVIISMYQKQTQHPQLALISRQHLRTLSHIENLLEGVSWWMKPWHNQLQTLLSIVIHPVPVQIQYETNHTTSRHIGYSSDNHLSNYFSSIWRTNPWSASGIKATFL